MCPINDFSPTPPPQKNKKQKTNKQKTKPTNPKQQTNPATTLPPKTKQKSKNNEEIKKPNQNKTKQKIAPFCCTRYLINGFQKFTEIQYHSRNISTAERSVSSFVAYLTRF